MAPLRDLAQLQCPGMCGTCKSGGNPSIKTRDGSLHVLIPNKKHYTVNVEGAVSNLFVADSFVDEGRLNRSAVRDT